MIVLVILIEFVVFQSLLEGSRTLNIVIYLNFDSFINSIMVSSMRSSNLQNPSSSLNSIILISLYSSSQII